MNIDVSSLTVKSSYKAKVELEQKDILSEDPVFHETKINTISDI